MKYNKSTRKVQNIGEKYNKCLYDLGVVVYIIINIRQHYGSSVVETLRPATGRTARHNQVHFETIFEIQRLV